MQPGTRPQERISKSTLHRAPASRECAKIVGRAAKRTHLAVLVSITSKIRRIKASAHSTVGDMNRKTMIGGRVMGRTGKLAGEAFESEVLQTGELDKGERGPPLKEFGA